MTISRQLRIAAALLAGVLSRARAESRQRLVELRQQEAQKLESLGVLAGGIARRHDEERFDVQLAQARAHRLAEAVIVGGSHHHGLIGDDLIEQIAERPDVELQR